MLDIVPPFDSVVEELKAKMEVASEPRRRLRKRTLRASTFVGCFLVGSWHPHAAS